MKLVKMEGGLISMRLKDNCVKLWENKGQQGYQNMEDGYTAETLGKKRAAMAIYSGFACGTNRLAESVIVL